jgi:hypothetical protein
MRVIDYQGKRPPINGVEASGRQPALARRRFWQAHEHQKKSGHIERQKNATQVAGESVKDPAQQLAMLQVKDEDAFTKNAVHCRVGQA